MVPLTGTEAATQVTQIKSCRTNAWRFKGQQCKGRLNSHRGRGILGLQCQSISGLIQAGAPFITAAQMSGGK